ncbi:MAG: PDDEXK nuclease domain-containing protein [Candidatus Eisenbacteria bacterium]
MKGEYKQLVGGIEGLLDEARRTAARSVNTLMTATYWEIGRRIVEFEQEGEERAEYGETLLKRLGQDLGRKYGRGFAKSNLYQMRAFYLAYPEKLQILSAKSGHRPLPDARPRRREIFQMLSGKSGIRPGELLQAIAASFPLPWSAYVRLMGVKDEEARSFYESEALRGGWSVRQLDRQIESQFYERMALSKNKAALLAKGAAAKRGDAVAPEEEVKDPYVLEFLDLKDEYAESDLEEALIRHLEAFLLELGGDFCFIGRQKRLRIGDEWYRVDLLFFHRRLRCLIVIDLKLGRFTAADAGQMHVYLDYAREHWTAPGENPPVGLILCAKKNEVLARYALDGLPNKVLAAEYRTVLPDQKLIAEEMERTRRMLEGRSPAGIAGPKGKRGRVSGKGRRR